MLCLRESHYPTDHLLTPLSADPRLHNADGTPCDRVPPRTKKRGPLQKPRWLAQFEAWVDGEWPVGRHGYTEVRQVVRQLRRQIAEQKRAGVCALCGKAR